MTPPHETRLARALLVQTVATGLIDAVSYLALGHVFTANMTGNVVFLGFAAGGAPAMRLSSGGGGSSSCPAKMSAGSPSQGGRPVSSAYASVPRA